MASQIYLVTAELAYGLETANSLLEDFQNKSI